MDLGGELYALDYPTDLSIQLHLLLPLLLGNFCNFFEKEVTLPIASRQCLLLTVAP